MTLVGWNTICQLKSCGGLEVRHLGDQNKAFIMKIDYSLITKTEALWVIILRAKYGVGEGLSNCIMRSRC